MARVLVVDDQRISRETARGILLEAGHDVEVAEDGPGGLKAALEWKPDVIVLDLNMPGMDGFAVLEELQREEATAPIPVLFLTAEPPRDELVVRGLGLGGFDFVTKGGSRSELIARVGVMARVKRSYDDLAAVARISDALIREREPQAIATAFVADLLPAFRAGAAFAYFAGDDRDAAAAIASRRTDSPTDVTGVELGRSLVGAPSGAVTVGDAPPPVAGWMERAGFERGLVTGLDLQSSEPAVAGVFSEDPAAFGHDGDIRLLQSLLGLAAVAVDNARLYARTVEQGARLKEQAERLERAMTERSRFFASISHEIRTPITAIVGYSQLLEDGILGELDERQKEAVQSTSRSAEHLRELVNDILDISRLESGKYATTIQAADLSELAEDAAMSLQLQAERKNLAFEIETPGPLPVETDPARVRQIILNLLSNAVKFTEEGSVRMTVGEGTDGQRAADGQAWRFVRVRDTGPGIPAEDHDRVFNEFEQVHATSEAGGTGLGLAISRKLARLLGGDLLVESAEGAGSIFRLLLPERAPPQDGHVEAGSPRAQEDAHRAGEGSPRAQRHEATSPAPSTGEGPA
ncbi:MAG TPA: ATP-binding protein [Longimicrobiales bacterium]|nr:ATP-binding protein [Longimicrobiales bacterium]